ncbi:HET domain-containing protein [Fusarium sp. LHS14.1]|nr:HET domain-containing protein [Fusarium sp. LHS14.1]
MSVADKCPSVGIKDTLAFVHGNNRRRARGLYKATKTPGVDATLSLPALAAYFTCMDASDDRDRLYGLMALSTDRSLLYADYFLSTQEVYLHFTQSFIMRHKSLDIICLASIYSDPSGSLPSWVPHWQKRNPQVIPSMVSQSSKTHIGNLRSPAALEVDPSVYYSALNNTDAVFEFEGSTLYARGAIIDTVDGLSGSRNFEMVQTSEQSSVQFSNCSGSTCSVTDILTSVCRSLALDRKGRYLRHTMPTADFFRDFISLLVRIVTKPSSSAPRELQEWFQWTRSLCIHGRSFENILHDCLQTDIDSSEAAPNEDEYWHDTFFGRFFDTVVRSSLRLMTSGNGRIGMVTEKALKGDLVCVLFGCSVPILLRKADNGDGFSLIGECFLDRCMDGSALEQPGLWEREFAIRY